MHINYIRDSRNLLLEQRGVSQAVREACLAVEEVVLEI